jgi:hypothetical protein
MRLDVVYRLLNHLTLALACACLVEAERPFLPALTFCLAPFLGLVVVAYLTEGRWVLPVWGANVLPPAPSAGWWCRPGRTTAGRSTCRWPSRWCRTSGRC